MHTHEVQHYKYVVATNQHHQWGTMLGIPYLITPLYYIHSLERFQYWAILCLEHVKNQHYQDII